MPLDQDSTLALLDDLFSLDQLNADPMTVYAVNPQYQLVFMNSAWNSFALANGAGPELLTEWTRGVCLLDALPEAVLGFYKKSYQKCMDSGQRWEHDYECSTATIYRKYHQVVYPLPGRSGLLIVNSLICEHQHPVTEDGPANSSGAIYLDKSGTVHQCCHCRRVQVQNKLERWDWVPAWVDKPFNPTSHGLCPTCLEHYYSPPD